MKKLKKSPQSGDEVAYLTALVKLMIKEDIKLGRYGAGAAQLLVLLPTEHWRDNSQ